MFSPLQDVQWTLVLSAILLESFGKEFSDASQTALFIEEIDSTGTAFFLLWSHCSPYQSVRSVSRCVNHVYVCED